MDESVHCAFCLSVFTPVTATEHQPHHFNQEEVPHWSAVHSELTLKFSCGKNQTFINTVTPHQKYCT